MYEVMLAAVHCASRDFMVIVMSNGNSWCTSTSSAPFSLLITQRGDLSWRPLGFNQRFPEVTAIASAMTAMWNLIPKERVGIALGGGAAASKPAGSRGVTSHLYRYIYTHTSTYYVYVYLFLHIHTLYIYIIIYRIIYI